MELHKPLTEKQFLSYDKIMWEETDKYDFTHYKTFIYPNEDRSLVEMFIWKDRSWKLNSSKNIHTDGILMQINDAIARQKESGERINGYKSTLKGRSTKPHKKCICNSAKRMIGKIPNFKKNLEKISF